MHRQRIPALAQVEPETYPLGENTELSTSQYAQALVALTHTPVEQRFYSAMLNVLSDKPSVPLFTARDLASMTGTQRLSTVRRALDGLLVKLSVELTSDQNSNGRRDQGKLYRVYSPTEVIERRKQKCTLSIDGNRPEYKTASRYFERALARVADNAMLSRREAQVALCCVEGLTNAEIGKRLEVSEQTVKFHMRHVFIKFGVKRRAELISRLLV